MQSNTKTIAKNTGLLLFANIFSKAIMFLIAIFIARSLSIEEFGFYSYALILGGVFLATSDLGVSTFVLREISKNYEKRNFFLASGINAKIVLSALTFFLAAAIIVFSGFSGKELVLFLAISIAFFMASFSILPFYCLRAKQNFSVETLLLTGAHILLTILVFVAMFLNMGFFGIGTAFVLSFLAMSILSFLFLQKNGFEITFKKTQNAIEIIRKSFLFGAAGFLITLFLDTDMIIIKYMLGDFSAGIYSVVFRFFMAALIFSTVFAEVIFPLLSKYAKNKEKFFRTFKKSILVSLITGIAMSIVLFVFGEKLILFLYGEKFLEAVGLIVWIVPAIPLVALNTVLISGLRAIHLEKQSFVNLLVATAINIGATIILIPVFGMVGAIITTIVALAVLTILNF
ncbi:MAG: flippase, partial [archaeon]|nr:flippase [archaeon]